MSSKKFDNENTGALYSNTDKKRLKDEKDTSKWPNTQGFINIYGVDFYLNGWTKIIKEGKKQGQKMVSLAVKPKDEEEGKKLEKIINKYIKGNENLDEGGGSSGNKPSEEYPEDDLPF